MGQTNLVLRGGRLIGSGRDRASDVLIIGETIRAVGEAGSLEGDDVLEVDGAWLMPGVIDAHTHPIHQETIASIGRVAPLGGVTTALEHLYPDPGEPPEQAARRALGEGKKGTADFGFHVRLVPDSATYPLQPLVEAMGVVSVKVFLAHSDPSVQCSLGELYEVMRKAAPLGLPVIVHAEFGDVTRRSEPPTLLTLEDFDASRPDYLEAACVASVCSIAEMTQARAYIAHVSSALALGSAVAARDRGVDVVVETCPHYLYLGTDSPLGGLGKVAPPLRRPANRERLRRAVKAGVIEVVASDHCGYGPEQKRRDDLAGSSNGLPALELLLPLLLNAVIKERWFDPARLVEVLCSGPAAAFGLQGKGHILPGYDADIVVIDPAAQTVVDPNRLQDSSFYSPYEDLVSLQGGIDLVFRRGKLLVQKGEICCEESGRSVSIRPPGGVTLGCP